MLTVDQKGYIFFQDLGPTEDDKALPIHNVDWFFYFEL